MPAQWHGAFVTRNRQTAAEFVTPLRVGCTNTPVSIRRATCGWSVAAAVRQVQLCSGDVGVTATQ